MATLKLVGSNVQLAVDPATGDQHYVTVDADGTITDLGVVGAAENIGETTDTPLGDATTAEGATARTGISLWKRLCNLLISLLGKFGAAGSANAAVLSIQGIASGTTLPVTEASGAAVLAAMQPVALATAVHVTNATSAAAVDVTCAAGTFAVEGYCESSFYYRRAATAVATDTLHPAGRFNIPAVAGTFSILVSSASATRIDAVPMGVA